MKKFFKFLLSFVLIMVITASVVVISHLIKNPQTTTTAQSDPALNQIITTLTKTKKHSGTLTISSNGKSATANIKITNSNSIAVSASADFSQFNINEPVELTLVENVIYLKVENNRLKLDLANGQSYLEQINTLLATLKPQLESLTGGANLIESTLASLGFSSLENITDLLDYITTTQTKQGYTLTFSYGKIELVANFDANYTLLNFHSNQIEINGSTFKISYTSKNAQNVSINKPAQASSFTSANHLLTLANSAANTLNKSSIHLSGTLNLSLPVIGQISIKVSALTKTENEKPLTVILLDNLPTGIYMNTKVYTLSLAHKNLRHYAYIYIDSGKIYFERFVSYQQKTTISGQDYYYKTEKEISQGFFTFADLQVSSKQTISYLTPVLGIGKTVTSAINLFGTNSIKLNLDNLLSSATYSYNPAIAKHTLTVDLKTLTSNRDLKNLTISIIAKNNSLTSLSFAYGMGSSVNLNATFAFKNKLSPYTHSYPNLTQTINPTYELTLKYNQLKNGYTKRTITTHI